MLDSRLRCSLSMAARTPRLARRPRRRIEFAFLFSAALLAGWAVAPRGVTASPGEVTGRASVQLVRFLDEVSATDRARFGPIHDVRLRLEAGFIVLVRHGGDFAAVLPIETKPGAPDSLHYFWFLERAPLLWVIPRGSDRGLRTVADGGEVRFDTFTLRWARGGDLGWIYFPDVPENRGVRVSVVSGNSVDRVDPRGTRYWVELGSGEDTGVGGF